MNTISGCVAITKVAKTGGAKFAMNFCVIFGIFYDCTDDAITRRKSKFTALKCTLSLNETSRTHYGSQNDVCTVWSVVGGDSVRKMLKIVNSANFGLFVSRCHSFIIDKNRIHMQYIHC